MEIKTLGVEVRQTTLGLSHPILHPVDHVLIEAASSALGPLVICWAVLFLSNKLSLPRMEA